MVIAGGVSAPLLWKSIWDEVNPDREKSAFLRRYKEANLSNIMRGLSRIKVAEENKIQAFFGVLRMAKIYDNNILDFGIVSCRVVTNGGVAAIVDAFQGLFSLANFRYHGIGTGTTAEAASDSALQTELSTQYNPDNTRATGTLAENASNIFRSVGTNLVDASVTITEHGLFNQAATGGGVLLDRSVFAGIALTSGNSLQSTYDFTINAGS